MLTFNSRNFFKKNITAPKGLFVKLILSVLSKKGNWAGMLRDLNKISLRSRQNLMNQVNFNSTKNNLTSFVVYKNHVLKSTNSSKQAIRKFSLSFFKNLNLLSVTRRSRLFLNLKNKQVADNFKINLVLSTLRSVHSLLIPIRVFIELKNKRRGGRVFSVPVPVKSDRRRHSIFIH
jgi:hypothetical protein